MSKINTDLDCAKQFSDGIYEDYKTAIEFLKNNPDYSLLKFRKITEELCALIGEKKSLEFPENNLFDRINTLNDLGIINHTTKTTLHELRIICNDAVHNKKEAADQDDSDFIKNAEDICQENAVVARNHIISLFEDIYLLLKLGEKLPKFSRVDIDDYSLKEIIFDAAVNPLYKAKLKAGIAYETIARQSMNDSPLIVAHSSILFHLGGLLKLAASHYDTAIKLSFESSQYSDSPKKIHQYCDIESLFRYARIASEKYVDELSQEEAFSLMKIAVDRGYPEAIAHYGACLLDDKRYEESKEYLDRAKKFDSAIANRYLYYYYTEFKIDEKLALEHLETAIELGCSDSIGILGALYHKGSIVDKDIDKAEELLLDGISKGSYVAKRYHLVEFNDAEGKINEEAKKFASELDKALEKVQKEHKELKPKPIQVEKIGRNDPCSCGSGKKYKKCCGNGIEQSVQPYKKLNIFK